MKTQLPSLRRHLRSLVLSFLLLLMLASVAFAEELKTPTTAEFLTQVETLRKERRIPGLSIAVVQDQSILLAAGLGWADLQNQIAATATTPYNIASVTKPISGVAVMRLVESGVLDLDRPIAQYSGWSSIGKTSALPK